MLNASSHRQISAVNGKHRTCHPGRFVASEVDRESGHVFRLAEAANAAAPVTIATLFFRREFMGRELMVGLYG
jgi:hypothetical protein